MSSEDLKKTVLEWANHIGQREAIKRLINADISLAVTQKLVVGNYVHELSFDKATAIISEMEKDGFSLAGEAS